MAVQDTVPPVLRASDADRESVIGMLRDGSAEGRRDLGSTNGTHVNGWAAGSGFTVRPGDRVRFGTAEFRITAG